ncbi:D(1A) dopamine receptor-like [Diadema setosum]|uniref:D(1A) dopamine receptor-like n=1 Tax=Diadema setosum TaxID=31175 RepID=UPI003B3B9F14
MDGVDANLTLSHLADSIDYPLNISNAFDETDFTRFPYPIFPLLTQVTVCIVSLVLNTLNIIVACHRHFDFPVSSRVTIVSMAVSDCLLSASLPVNIILFHIPGISTLWPKLFCRFFLVLTVTCVRMSVIALVLIIVDRYFAIASPFRHQRYATKKVCIWTMLGAWFFMTVVHIIENATGDYFFNPLLVTCEVVVSPSRMIASVSLFYFIPLTTMIVVYAHLLIIVRKMMRDMATIHPQRQAPGNQPGECVEQARERPPRNHGNKHFKVIITFFAITMAFTLTNVPNRMTRIVTLLHGPGAVSATIIFFCRIIVITGSWWNFVIFSLMNTSFRRILKKIFTCRSTI